MHLLITGTRGIPAHHGGFETFAQDLSLYLVQRGHQVTVFCQSDQKNTILKDIWKGVVRIHHHGRQGSLGTVLFDWASIRRAMTHKEAVVLTLGYNTAVFNSLLRFVGIPNLINMDGIEWKRQKWSFPQRLWLRLNERIAASIGTHLIADHPEIKRHLLSIAPASKISVIPYGAEEVVSGSDIELGRYGLVSKHFFLVIARPEPENSVLQVVKAYSEKPRHMPLVILGSYSMSQPYQREVLNHAGPGVVFLGPIYESSVVRSLRFHAFAYIHGHTVGGTNPSLVEALACGSAVIAHDNEFNRWVAGGGARYFCAETDLATVLDEFEEKPYEVEMLQLASRARYLEGFQQSIILNRYEALLMRFADEVRESESVIVRRLTF